MAIGFLLIFISLVIIWLLKIQRMAVSSTGNFILTIGSLASIIIASGLLLFTLYQVSGLAPSEKKSKLKEIRESVGYKLMKIAHIPPPKYLPQTERLLYERLFEKICESLLSSLKEAADVYGNKKIVERLKNPYFERRFRGLMIKMRFEESKGSGTAGKKHGSLPYMWKNLKNAKHPSYIKGRLVRGGFKEEEHLERYRDVTQALNPLIYQLF